MSQPNISKFLKGTEWVNSHEIPMGADMGLRRYARLEKDGRHALFMDMSRSGILETGLKEYVEIAEYLRTRGVTTPEIYVHDLGSGLSVIEEVGRQSFGDKVKEGHSRSDIYMRATDVLIQIKDQALQNDLGLKGYEKTLIRERLRQFVDYYVPAMTEIKPNEDLVGEFENILEGIARKLQPCPMGFCHADYHLENVMWCSDKSSGYGLIDFQDAFWGFQGYDLLNLLEDARQSVPIKTKLEMKARYCKGMNLEERQTFDDWYALMSMHFHCRVIGLFIKFSQENGTTEFLAHIPRLQGYITENLKNSIFSPFKEWLDNHDIRFDVMPRV
jgi:aminoglycoside/choline kinase family phosphotransferase